VFGHCDPVTGEELQALMETVFARDRVDSLAREYGVVERARALDVREFLVALVLTGGTDRGGRQYDALRTYIENGAVRVARSAFYSWFNDPLERLLMTLLQDALAHAHRVEKLLPGILGTVSDWRIVDSTTVKLDDELIEEWPGTGDYAALKVHKEWSVGAGNLLSFKITPARDHDSPHLIVDESRRGTGLLIDLGYASLARLADCEKHDVRYVIRLKDSWKPRIDRIVRGAVGGDIVATGDFDVLLEQDIFLHNDRAIDADVTVGRGSSSIKSRLVGVPTPKGYCFFLTNLPRKTHGPLQVGDLYRVRWEIEVDNKVDKTGARIDAITARKPVSVRILLLASLLNTVLARIIVQREKLAIVKQKAQGTRAPLHPIQVVRAMTMCQRALLLTLDNQQSTSSDWSKAMMRIRDLGHDPNWRRRPSVLDIIQGLTGEPQPRRVKGKKLPAKGTN
jgi:hypothetical protein